MNENQHKIFFYISIATLTIAMLFMLGIGYLLWIDGGKESTYNTPMKISKITDDNIYVIIDYCKYHSYPTEVHASYVDGFIYNLKIEKSIGLPVGCHKVERMFEIPKGLPNGKYHLEVTINYNVNILKKVTNNWYSEDFEINRISEEEQLQINTIHSIMKAQGLCTDNCSICNAYKEIIK